MDKDLQLASLRDEWLMFPVKSRAAADFEASGLLMGMKKHANFFTTNRLQAARRLTGPGKFPLWPMSSYAELFPLTVSMITRPNHKPSVKFICPPAILKTPKSLRSSWQWLKGLWGSAGGLYFPKTGYYLTLIVSDADTAEILRRVLPLTGLSWSEHRHEFTLRNHDDIMTFLCNAGMPAGSLEFDATVMMRAVRSRVNRESNYDSANIARSLKAACEQTELARKIVSAGLLGELPAELREIVSVRLEFPDESLAGLGRRLAHPITKATVRYRWGKVQAIVEGMKAEHKPNEKL